MKRILTAGIAMLFLFSSLVYAQTRMVVQAETGTFSSGTKVETEYSGYTGSGYVNTNNAVGAFIEIEFSVKNGGPDTIWVYYAMQKTDDRSANVFVNEVQVLENVAFPSTGSYTNWQAVSFVVNLNKGTNKLRLVARSSNGLSNIDRFEISDEQGTRQYQLTINIQGKGSVTREPNALYYDEGTVVTLTAIPDTSVAAIFLGWSGDVSGTSNPVTITMNGSKTVTASFKATIHSSYYISPSGNDATGDGSRERPFYSLQKAVDLVAPGDTIFMFGGVYQYNTRVTIKTVGTPEENIWLRSMPGERAILDFSAMADADANQGIRLTGSYWHFYGFDIKGAGDNGLLIERDKPSGGDYSTIKDSTHQAHHNIIEYCSFYENRDSGIQLKNLAAYNRIINCDSYYNRDASDGDADGFAPKLTVGDSNYFYGCRAWQNSDDGFDLYLKATEDGFPDDMTTIIENCWVFSNGYLKDGSPSSGNGNGFKLGGSGNKDQRHNVILRRCLSFENLQKGFDQNSNMGNMTLINCTGFAHPYLENSSHFTYRIDGTTLPSGKQLVYVNCVAVWDGITDRKKSAWAPCEMIGGVSITNNLQTSPSDYISIDTTGVRGPRKADGSLPDVNFMHIAPGNTRLIDTGTPWDGITYTGSAPDLGAFETEPVNEVSSVAINAPRTFQLEQNYPNPFNPATQLRFSVSERSYASLKVFDVMGREVATLFDGIAETGRYYTASFNGGGQASGIYFAVLQANGKRSVTKMMLMK